ncbi:alpha-ketoglutarate-dependent dioxygenase AlkB [soil metagenome]
MFDVQESLFGIGEPSIDPDFSALERWNLESGAWLDVVPQWLEGDGTLYEALAESQQWDQPDVVMYERIVTTPRLVSSPSQTCHVVLAETVSALSRRYGVDLNRLTANWYRDGSDSVAWHGDRVARDLERSVVAVLSLRGPREFRFKPASGGASLSLSAGLGDLVVMGGTFQRTWRHAVPKCSAAPPRMAVMFRHEYDRSTLNRLSGG